MFGVVIFSAAAMLAVTAIVMLPLLFGNEMYLDNEMPVYVLEIVSLAAAAAGFWFLCDRAFRFGTANGASRRSVIGSVLVVLLPTALITTVICQVITYLLALPENSNWWENLYDKLFYAPWEEDWSKVYDLPEFVYSGALYFLILAAVLATVCVVYAAYRKYGLFGAICGVLAAAMVFAVLSMIFYAQESALRGIKSLFAEERELLDYVDEEGKNHWYEILVPHPKAFFILTAGYLAAAGTAFGLMMRRVSVRPAELEI